MSIVESRDGSLWVGTDGGGVARFRGGNVVERIAGLPNARVRALVETGDGDLWIAASWRDTRLIVKRSGEELRQEQEEICEPNPLFALRIERFNVAGLAKLSRPLLISKASPVADRHASRANVLQVFVEVQASSRRWSPPFRRRTTDAPRRSRSVSARGLLGRALQSVSH
jgi:ligand-binding sensor domain-containing protein